MRFLLRDDGVLNNYDLTLKLEELPWTGWDVAKIVWSMSRTWSEALGIRSKLF